MRAALGLVLTLTLAVAGCTFNDVDPEADVRITGRALDAAGEPLAGTARPKNALFASCAATDGDLDQPARLRGKGVAAVTGVVVDLGTARGIDLVVARGFAGQVLVEVSADGRSFTTAATSPGFRSGGAARDDCTLRTRPLPGRAGRESRDRGLGLVTTEP